MVSECSQCLVQRAPAEPSQKFGPEVDQTFHVEEILGSPVKRISSYLVGCNGMPYAIDNIVPTILSMHMLIVLVSEPNFVRVWFRDY